MNSRIVFLIKHVYYHLYTIFDFVFFIVNIQSNLLSKKYILECVEYFNTFKYQYNRMRLFVLQMDQHTIKKLESQCFNVPTPPPFWHFGISKLLIPYLFRSMVKRFAGNFDKGIDSLICISKFRKLIEEWFMVFPIYLIQTEKA